MRNYSSSPDSFERLPSSTNGEGNDVNSLHTFSFIDLSELANFPKVQNNVIFQIFQIQNKMHIECRKLVEKKNKEHGELKDELDKLGHVAEDCVQSLSQMEHKCYIKRALEFICAQVMLFVCLFLPSGFWILEFPSYHTLSMIDRF